MAKSPTPFLTAFFFVVLLALSTGTGTLRAQTTGTVTGTVTDAEDGEPMIGANVVALDASGALIGGAAVQLDGRYRFVIPAGMYTIRSRYVGYQDCESMVTVESGATVTVDCILSQSGLELNTVVVAASRRQEKALDAPASISVLNARDVETSVGTSSVEALRTTPGVDMQQTGVDRREMVLRGFNNAFSGATYILTDYRQAAVPSLAVNLYSIMPNMNIDVERIEVVRGPGSALYGAGVDAGVVHFITKDPFNHPGTTISVQGGERSFFGAQFRHAGVAAQGKVGYKLTGMYGQANDWTLDASDAIDKDYIIPGLSRDNQYQKSNINGLIEYRLAEDAALIFNGGYSALTGTVLSGIGTVQADGFGYRYGQVRFRTGGFFAQAYYNKNNAGDSFVYGQDFDNDGISDPVVDNGSELTAQAQYDMDIMEGRTNLVFGADMTLTRPDTEGTILGRNEDNDNIDEYGGYIQSTMSINPKLDLTLALRGDYNSVVENMQLSPRAALVVKPNPRHSFRATYNRAFSSPGTNSNFLDIVAGQVGGLITVRGRGSAYGYTWDRNSAYAGLAGTDLVASSLNPAALGQDTPVGLPLDNTYAQVYSGLAAIPNAQLAAILNNNGIPVNESQAGALKAMLDPSQTQVSGFSRGLLGIVNPNTLQTQIVNDLVDIDPLEQTITQTFEVGYKGLFGNKLVAAVDVYYSKKKNFIGPLLMETPLVLVPNLSADLSAAIATGIRDNATLAGTLNAFGVSPEAAAGLIVNLAAGDLPDGETPVAIVQPIENNAGPGNVPELMLSYRNFGNVDFWGVDASFQYMHSEALSFFGNMSYVSDDYFDADELGEGGTSLTLHLNAPMLKGRGGFEYQFQNGLSVNAAGRYTDEFPISSGPYAGTIEAYFLLDVGAGYDLNQTVPGLRFDVSVSNVTDNVHHEFIGAPAIGRMALARLTYDIQ